LRGGSIDGGRIMLRNRDDPHFSQTLSVHGRAMDPVNRLCTRLACPLSEQNGAVRTGSGEQHRFPDRRIAVQHHLCGKRVDIRPRGKKRVDVVRDGNRIRRRAVDIALPGSLPP